MLNLVGDQHYSFTIIIYHLIVVYNNLLFHIAIDPNQINAGDLFMRSSSTINILVLSFPCSSQQISCYWDVSEQPQNIRAILACCYFMCNRRVWNVIRRHLYTEHNHVITRSLWPHTSNILGTEMFASIIYICTYNLLPYCSHFLLVEGVSALLCLYHTVIYLYTYR